MPLNKFGQSLQRQSNTNSILSKLQYGNKGLKYTLDGNIDVENLKICNVKLPTLNGDAANREYVEDKFTNVLKLYTKLEKATIQALHKKQDLLKINLKTEIAIITHNTDELKKQTEELNKEKTKIISDIESLKKQIEKLDKQKTKIISDLDSLEHISIANVTARTDLTNKVIFIQKTVETIRKDINENLKKNKKQIENLEGKNIEFEKKFDDIFKFITVPANVSTIKQVQDLGKKIVELENKIKKTFIALGIPF